MRSLPSRLGISRPRTRSGGSVNSIDDALSSLAHQEAAYRRANGKMRIPHPKSCGIRTGGSTTPSSVWFARCVSVGMCLAMTVRRRRFQRQKGRIP